MRFTVVGFVVFFVPGFAVVFAADYQQQQRDQAYDAWRQRAFFNSSSSSNSNSFAPSQPAPARDYSATDAMLAQQKRVNEEHKRDVAAYNEKLARQIVDAKARHAEAYRQARNDRKGRLPLHEPPDFANDQAMYTWYFNEARGATSDDSYVLWTGALFALRYPTAGATLVEARQWLEKADQTWPEIQGLLSRMRVLGEGGAAVATAGEWERLLAAEKVLKPQEFLAAGRLDLYFAKGCALAEGKIVAADPLEALIAFDETARSNEVNRGTVRYLMDVFWPKYAENAAEIVARAQTSSHRWTFHPFDSLRMAAQQRRTPAEIEEEKRRLGLNLASMEDLLGNAELQYQLFLYQHREDRRSSSFVQPVVLEAIEALELRGLKKIAMERLLPDRFGGFLDAKTPAQYEEWIAAGKASLEEAAAKGNPRAFVAKARLALHPLKGEADFAEAARWADKGLTIGDPWAALQVVSALIQKRDEGQAVAYMKRINVAEGTPAVAHEIAQFFFLPEDTDTEEILRTHFRKLGAKSGNLECALALANTYQQRLSWDLARAEEDESNWSRAEEILEPFATKNAAITTMLAGIRQRHARYDEERAERHRVSHEGDEERDRQKKAAAARGDQIEREEIAAQIPGAGDRFVKPLAQLVERLNDPTAVWTWDDASAVYPTIDDFSSDEERGGRRLLAARENAERALKGHILLAPEVLKQGQAALGAARMKPLREALVRVFTQAAANNAEAATVLADLGPVPEGPMLTRTLEGELHAVRWLRHALKLGSVKAIFALANRYYEQPTLAALYEPADQHAHDGSPGPDQLAAVIALLPSEDVERAALTAEAKAIDARRERAVKMVADESPKGAARIVAALDALDLAAQSRTREASPALFFKAAATETSPGATDDLEGLDRTAAINRLLLARMLERVLGGDLGAIERAAELVMKYDPAQAARFIGALRPLLVSDANHGSVSAIKKLIVFYRPDPDTPELSGWALDEEEAVKWSRRALLAGVGDVVDYPAELYSGQHRSRLYDSRHFLAWSKFAAKFREELGDDAKPAEIAAFAKTNLPPE